MNSQIAAILTIDGIASGAIYVLIAIGFVLIFAVTRIIFVPFGDVTAFTALTLASLEGKQLPGTIGMVAVLAALALSTGPGPARLHPTPRTKKTSLSPLTSRSVAVPPWPSRAA